MHMHMHVMSLLCRRGQHRAALLLHNPSCSKSRAALGLLQQSGAAFDTREYLREPLSLVELEELQARLGQPVRWTRRADPAWAERFGDADAVPSNEACLRALVEVPTLLERPRSGQEESPQPTADGRHPPPASHAPAPLVCSSPPA